MGLSSPFDEVSFEADLLIAASSRRLLIGIGLCKDILEINDCSLLNSIKCPECLKYHNYQMGTTSIITSIF